MRTCRLFLTFKITKDVLDFRWMDRREVCMANTFIKHEMVGSVSSNPNNSRLKPQSVLTYNTKMGGVDDVDKVMKPHQSIRKSTKWYKKAFFHLWDYSVYNSFVGYKIMHQNSSRRIKAFIEALTKEIFQEYPSVGAKRGRPSLLISDQRLAGSHFPQQVFNEDETVKNHRCFYCNITRERSTTTFQCDTCQVWLCVKGSMSCFKKYHTQRNLPDGN